MTDCPYKKLDMFKSMEYWGNIRNTEYNYRTPSNYNPNYTPNKPRECLDINTKKMNTFFQSLTPILKLIIDEYVLIHMNAKSGSHIYDDKLMKYC